MRVVVKQLAVPLLTLVQQLFCAPALCDVFADGVVNSTRIRISNTTTVKNAIADRRLLV
jgi:hypothetical protein